MANLKDSPHFDNHDDYYTRKKAWDDIKEFIPEDKIIWEACLLNSNEQSKKYLEELGFNVVGNIQSSFLTGNKATIFKLTTF